MKLKLMLSALAFAFTASGSVSHELCEGFVPQNNYRVPVGKTLVGVTQAGGLSEAQFNKILDRIELLYADVVKAKGGTLKINRLWKDETVNASAQQMGGQWVLNMYGGLARSSDITEEGFALVACHELGHHLGGAPKTNILFGLNAWATNEGGADYYSTLKCLRHFFADDDNESIVNARGVDATARNMCENQFSTKAEVALCERISLSGESVAYLFQTLRKETTKPQYSTPDTTEVTKTNDDHPQTQCRMDTYFAGMTCQASLSVDPDNKDFKVGSCVQGVDKVGFRPRCWFQPEQAAQGSCPLGSDAICQAACQVSPSLPFCQSKSIFY